MKKNIAALRAAVVGAVAALGMGLAAVPATADPIVPLPALPELPGTAPQTTPNGKQIVTFGDSFTAHAGKGGPRGVEMAQTPWAAKCATDRENWPKIAGNALGKTVGDWSCNGMSVDMALYLEMAIQYGDLGPDTEEVVIMYGGLDPFYWVDGAVQLVNPGAVTNASVFRQFLLRVQDRVREVAPKARLTLASYPEYISGDTYCPVNFGPVVTPIPAPGATAVQTAMRDTIRETAAGLGANFIDVYTPSVGHGTCNPDPEQRWTVGFLDSTEHTMPSHPSNAGQRAMGGIIAEGLRG
ncbi:SGNH/GDSL hydrolase family protein [Corynebacterium sp. zg-331]|uniref:GDSL-type esterase/lipase family protein n=1 Tax=unclassified Corynebacterium TaxID=2624378 RepID=UPI00128BA5B6|nr:MULTISPECIES: GDSL-type esterase/lipase family protein [unclassified Corynebacterium]MBC3185767.1 SGNH/GDSL hydrolase family protein [Corynebacterium sp. zg-331]MPV52260.1 SGNH/GDSL hydrolase family protein [Corynebacterium sp. zg331]